MPPHHDLARAAHLRAEAELDRAIAGKISLIADRAVLLRRAERLEAEALMLEQQGQRTV